MESCACENPEAEKSENKPDQPEMIPFQLGEHLKLRSMVDPSLKTRAEIVGVCRKEAILIEQPSFMKDDQIAGRIGGGIVCAYFVDGWLFKFKSRFGQIILNDIICLDYPKKFEAQQLRAHPRVKVMLEAVCAIGRDHRLIHSNIMDISEGGCCLVLPCLITPGPGTPVELTFELPNNELIEDLQCDIKNIRQEIEEKRTFVGLSFSKPDVSVEKIRQFCEMCSYFRV